MQTIRLRSQDIVRVERMLAFIKETEPDNLTYPRPCRTPTLSGCDDLYSHAFNPSRNLKTEVDTGFMYGVRDWLPFYGAYDLRDHVFYGSSWSSKILRGTLPVLYGSIHLVAWYYQFPTSVERIMWMASCLTLCVATPALVSLSSLPSLLFQGRMFSLLETCSFVVLLIYGAARIFLIVESFLSLRSLPIGVFWLPSWLQMIPHV
jgi:hypothetical protein